MDRRGVLFHRLVAFSADISLSDRMSALLNNYQPVLLFPNVSQCQLSASSAARKIILRRRCSRSRGLLSSQRIPLVTAFISVSGRHDPLVSTQGHCFGILLTRTQSPRGARQRVSATKVLAMQISIPPFASTLSPIAREEGGEHDCKPDGVSLLQVRRARRSFLEHLDHELFLNLIQFVQRRIQGEMIFKGAFAENVSKLKAAPLY